jgi:hypothetical protein
MPRLKPCPTKGCQLVRRFLISALRLSLKNIFQKSPEGNTNYAPFKWTLPSNDARIAAGLRPPRLRGRARTRHSAGDCAQRHRQLASSVSSRRVRDGQRVQHLPLAVERDELCKSEHIYHGRPDVHRQQRFRGRYVHLLRDNGGHSGRGIGLFVAGYGKCAIKPKRTERSPHYRKVRRHP